MTWMRTRTGRSTTSPARRRSPTAAAAARTAQRSASVTLLDTPGAHCAQSSSPGTQSAPRAIGGGVNRMRRAVPRRLQPVEGLLHPVQGLQRRRPARDPARRRPAPPPARHLRVRQGGWHAQRRRLSHLGQRADGGPRAGRQRPHIVARRHRGLEALFTLYGDAPQSWKVVEYASETGATWDAVGDRPAGAAGHRTGRGLVEHRHVGLDPGARLCRRGSLRARARRQGAGGAAAWSDLGAVDPDTIVVRSDARECRPA